MNKNLTDRIYDYTNICVNYSFITAVFLIRINL